VRGERFDAVVIGAGPAGSVAATVLARGGARVALVDKADFPRDKACGDLIGPRGVRLLDDLGVTVPDAIRVGDMVVVGPRHRVRLPCRPGRTYPGHGLAVPRRAFDARLREVAISAGAEPVVERAAAPIVGDGGLQGCTLTDGRVLLGDVVIGADGARSRVAEWAGLVDPARVLWGFAVRAYVEQRVALPEIYWWEPTPRRAFPGYGWLFPGPDGRGNLGLGCGVLADRGAAGAAARQLPRFAADLVRRGALAAVPATDGAASLGGWLKLGMVGTRPAAGRVLLVGDAAGLVNPLQGEGIAPAAESGRAAAAAVLADPAGAAERYRRFLADRYAPYQAATAPLHAAMLPRPRAVSAVARALTGPGLGSLLAGGWAVYWNDLLDGAEPGPPRAVARLAQGAFERATSAGAMRRWFRRALGAAEPTGVRAGAAVS
jgi:geranylgeranyl reductase family protein